MFLTLSNLGQHGDSALVSIAKVMWTYKGDANSASGENWKLSSSAILPEASFNDNSNEETLNVNKTCWQ